MRKRTIVGIVFLLFLLVLLVGSVCLFFLLESWVGTSEEINRCPSPDSVLDAVVVRTNPGAMSSFGYRVFLVLAGDRPKEKDEVLHGIGLHEMQVKWRESRVLEIHYEEDKAEIGFFKDSWTNEKRGVAVEIRKVPH